MKRVLIVDDEPSIREMIADLLHDEGYGVLLAGSGRRALALLETEQPDLVLLDLMMPDGDGREVLHAMQAQPSQRIIPVVILCIRGVLPPLDGVPVGYLIKPFDLDHLLAAVTRAIGPAIDSDGAAG